MGNLSLKEKLMFGAVILLLVVVVIYFVVISPLQASIESTETELAILMEKDKQYTLLSGINSGRQEEISTLEAEIADLESSFLPELNTDAIVTYVEQVFENNGCPYLAEVSSQQIPMDTIILPDGSISPDSLKCMRMIFRYQSTDGYNIPEYNGQEQWYDGNTNMELVAENVAQMGNFPREGLEGFFLSIEEISEVNPSAIKINRVFIEDSLQGYLNMTVEIDFYAGQFTDRVTEVDSSAPYVTFNGQTPTTGSGMIGFPIFVDDSNSTYYGYILAPTQFTMEGRQFAAWFSSGITMTYAMNQIPLYSYIENPETGEFELVSAASEFTPTTGEFPTAEEPAASVVAEEAA